MRSASTAPGMVTQSMHRVRATDHSRGPWLLEIVELGGAHTDVEAIARPGWVVELAGVAQV